MAKTSSTVHLEDSTWEEIKEYQQQYGCTRNEAIERMFVERRVLMNLNYNSNKNNDTKVEIDKEELAAAVDSAYEDMPE